MLCCGLETVPRQCQKWSEAQTNINKCLKNETRKWEREACSAFGIPSKNDVHVRESGQLHHIAEDLYTQVWMGTGDVRSGKFQEETVPGN